MNPRRRRQKRMLERELRNGTPLVEAEVEVEIIKEEIVESTTVVVVEEPSHVEATQEVEELLSMEEPAATEELEE